jgi:hypothetical protein
VRPSGFVETRFFCCDDAHPLGSKSFVVHRIQLLVTNVSLRSWIWPMEGIGVSFVITSQMSGEAVARALKCHSPEFNYPL